MTQCNFKFQHTCENSFVLWERSLDEVWRITLRRSHLNGWISNFDLRSLSFGHRQYFKDVSLIGDYQVQKKWVDFKIRIFVKVRIGQALLERLDSWSKFTLKPTVVESHYLSNFGFSNEEIDPKFGMYTKNWARQVWLENFDFRLTST